MVNSLLRGVRVKVIALFLVFYITFAHGFIYPHYQAYAMSGVATGVVVGGGAAAAGTVGLAVLGGIATAVGLYAVLDPDGTRQNIDFLHEKFNDFMADTGRAGDVSVLGQEAKCNAEGNIAISDSAYGLFSDFVDWLDSSDNISDSVPSDGYFVGNEPVNFVNQVSYTYFGVRKISVKSGNPFVIVNSTNTGFGFYSYSSFTLDGMSVSYSSGVYFAYLDQTPNENLLKSSLSDATPIYNYLVNGSHDREVTYKEKDDVLVGDVVSIEECLDRFSPPSNKDDNGNNKPAVIAGGSNSLQPQLQTGIQQLVESGDLVVIDNSTNIMIPTENYYNVYNEYWVNNTYYNDTTVLAPTTVYAPITTIAPTNVTVVNPTAVVPITVPVPVTSVSPVVINNAYEIANVENTEIVENYNTVIYEDIDIDDSDIWIDVEVVDDSGGGFIFDLSNFFPFCLPMDLYLAFKMLADEPKKPVFIIPMDFQVFDHTVHHDFVIDIVNPTQNEDEMQTAVPYVIYLRWFLTFIFIVFLIFTTIKITPH